MNKSDIVCTYCKNTFSTKSLLIRHQTKTKYCLQFQGELDKINKEKLELENKVLQLEKEKKDIKQFYEITLLNLETKLFEIQGQNIIYKKKLEKKNLN